MEIHVIIDGRLKSGTAQGQILFWDNTLKKWVFAETSELFWDDANKRLGIGIANLIAALHIESNATGSGSWINNGILLKNTGNPIGEVAIVFNNIDTEADSLRSWFVGLNDNDVFRISYDDSIGGLTNENTKFAISTTGEVSIGTERTGQSVHVANASNATLLLHTESDTLGTFGALLFKSDANPTGTSRIKGGIAFERLDTFGRGSLHILVDNTANTSNVDLNDAKMTVHKDGNIGLHETSPETILEMTSIVPYLTLHNSTEENGDGGRESRINFKGEQDGTEETTLARIEVSHDGADDDEKGKFVISVNDGDDGDTPTDRFKIDAAGVTHIGDGTNETQISNTGDVTFFGTGGLLFGQMSIPGVDIEVTTGDADPHEVSHIATGDGWATRELNEVTFGASGSEHHLIVPVVGKWKIIWQMSAHTGGGGATAMHGGVRVNGAFLRNCGEGHTHVGNFNDDQQISGVCVIDIPSLAAGNDEISLWVQSDNGQDVHVEHGDMCIEQVGGT